MNWKDKFPKENIYFETENGILYNGDCLNIMKQFPEESIDAIITDPPYGVTQNQIDQRLDYKIMWKYLKLIRKQRTPIILFGQGLFFYELVLSNKNEFKYDLIWNKILTTGFLNAKRMPLRQHEYIGIFYKRLPTYNPQFWKGKPLHSKGKNYKNKKIKNQNYGKFKHINDERSGSIKKYPRSILIFQKPHPSKTVHPTQKPLDLMKYLIKTYTNENNLVLDFTCGSGTTLIACDKLNRKWIGIEINKEYCEITKKRIIEVKNELERQIS